MQEELTRSINLLEEQPVAPYFLSYEITETQGITVRASFGALTYSDESRGRQLDIDLRVGDYAFDNTHQVRGGPSNWSDRYSMIEIPIEDDPDAIRSVLWYHTDKKYKRALEQLTTVKTNIQVKVEEEDQSDDFSKEPVERYVEAVASFDIARDAWEAKLKKYTAPFAQYGDIYEADASLWANISTRQYVNSEGSEIQTSQVLYRLFIYAFNVLPIMVYRIYIDGREELVRGVDLIGTPLTAFSQIAAADDQMDVFNGICGAESGGVPVAAVSPGIFISQIEVQKKEKSQERRPILKAPFSEAAEAAADDLP